MYWYIHTKRIYQHPYSSYLLTCNILFRPSEYFVREICFTLLIEACHHFTNRMSTTVRDIDISLDWLVSRSRTKRADEIGFRFLANCREINVSPSRHVYIRTKTSPLVTLYVEGLFTILCSQCRAPLLRKPNMNFFFFLFFPSWWMDVWAPTSIYLILPKGFPNDRSCLSVGIEIFVYPYVHDAFGRLDCKLSSSVPLIISKFHSIRFC